MASLIGSLTLHVGVLNGSWDRQSCQIVQIAAHSCQLQSKRHLNLDWPVWLEQEERGGIQWLQGATTGPQSAITGFLVQHVINVGYDLESVKKNDGASFVNFRTPIERRDRDNSRCPSKRRTSRMPKLEQFEIKKYWQIFSGLKPQDNKLNHDQVLPILYNSKLDSSVLNKIWFLADIDDDDNLDFEEFVICMRMIFDMVNKNIDSVPDELPDWLIPGSKAKLVKERRKRKQAENAQLGIETISAPSEQRSSDSQSEMRTQPRHEAPEVDFYISPSNKELYDSIYNSCNTFTDGTVSFPALAAVVRSKFPSVASSDMDKVWSLVNPKNAASINRDPAVYLIHVLKQVSELGCALPTQLPHGIKEICNQERVTYDLKSEQGDVKRSTRQYTTISSDNRSSGVQRKRDDSDLGVTEGTDWEVVRLKRQLADLDAELSRVNATGNEANSSQSGNLRQQFENLLKYKEKQLSSSSTGNSYTSVNVRGVSEDLENIEQQVGVLEQYLSNKRQELQSLAAEIQSLK